MKASQLIKKISWVDAICVAALLYVLVSMGPRWWFLHNQEGETIKPFSIATTTGQVLHFPGEAGKHIVVFWATWCGPCTFELARFNRAVTAGDLPAERVIAVSLGEDPALVKTESDKRGYKFTVAVDPEGHAGDTLQVSSTPTVFYLDEGGVIAHASAGFSPFAIYRSELFLQN